MSMRWADVPGALQNKGSFPVGHPGNVATALDNSQNISDICPDIALLGGRPAFTEMLAVGRPNVPNRRAFLARVERMMEGRQFTNNGPMVREFEAEVARDMAADHCIATCNATVGLELIVHALGLKGEVIVPSFTFVATVHALYRQNIRPVFCDVDPETHCLDPEAVEALITSSTTGILGVSLWGTYSGEAALRDIADRHGLKFILDSAHSYGCAHEDGTMTRHCHAEVLSFHATKCIQAMEGGAILTDDDEVAERLRFLVNFGFAGEDKVLHLGTNGKMNEAEAAMGLTSLEAKERIFTRNRLNLEAYAAGLKEVPGIRLVGLPRPGTHNCQYVVAEVDAGVMGLTRDELVGALRAENVFARRYFHPGVHRMEPYSGLFPDAGERLPVTERLARNVMVLPNGLEVSRGMVMRLTDRIAAIARRAGEVREALKGSGDPRVPEFAR